jgi:hypothetical protein
LAKAFFSEIHAEENILFSKHTEAIGGVVKFYNAIVLLLAIEGWGPDL